MRDDVLSIDGDEVAVLTKVDLLSSAERDAWTLPCVGARLSDLQVAHGSSPTVLAAAAFGARTRNEVAGEWFPTGHGRARASLRKTGGSSEMGPSSDFRARGVFGTGLHDRSAVCAWHLGVLTVVVEVTILRLARTIRRLELGCME